jgi:hypothetical protein
VATIGNMLLNFLKKPSLKTAEIHAADSLGKRISAGQ